MAQIMLYSIGLLQRSVRLHSTANNPQELNMSGGFNKGNEGTLGMWSEFMKSFNPFYFSYAAFLNYNLYWSRSITGLYTKQVLHKIAE